MGIIKGWVKEMKKKKILLAYNNSDLIREFSRLLNVNGVYELKDYVLDGEDLMRVGSFDPYHIVIVKDALMHVSGLYAIESILENTEHRPELILLLTPFLNDFIIQKCGELGIKYKGDNVSNAYSILDIIYKYDIENSSKNKYYFDVQYEIITLLKKIGLLRSYLGYTYFEYALNIMFEKSENIYKSMKDIYTLIARHFDVTATSVEKAMRTCIKCSLTKNDNYFARTIFGYDVKLRDFPSTSTFLQVSIKMLKEQKFAIINNNIHKSIRKI